MIIENLDFYRQKHPSTCVPYSLATVLRFYGKEFTPAELIKALKTHTWLGTDFCFSLDFLFKQGFSFFPFCNSARVLSGLLDEGFPVLLYTKHEHGIHCSVIYGCDAGSGSLIIHDPSLGPVEKSVRELDRAGVDKQFGGLCYYLVVLPGTGAKPPLVRDLVKSDPFYYNICGELEYYFFKNPGAALGLWEKALALKEDYAEVYNNLAVYHLETTGLLDRALEMVNTAIGYDREELTYRITVGEIYLRQKRASVFNELITELDKKWPKNFDVLGLKKRGKKEFGA